MRRVAPAEVGGEDADARHLVDEPGHAHAGGDGRDARAARRGARARARRATPRRHRPGRPGRAGSACAAVPARVRRRSTRADFVSVPPTSKASTGLAGAERAPSRRRSHGGHSRSRMTERVRLRGGRGRGPWRGRGRGRRAGRGRARPSGRACPPRTGPRCAATSAASPSGGVAEVPGDPAGCGDRDRAVAVLHGRVRLGPRLRGLAHLERGLVGEPDGPAAAEEGELLGVDELGVELLGDGARGVGDGAGRGPRRARRGGTRARWWRSGSARPTARRRTAASRRRRRGRPAATSGRR